MDPVVLWTAVGAVGTCVAAVVGIALFWYALFNDYGKRPKLSLSFDNSRDVKTQTNTIGLDPPSTVSRWLRVRVENANGRRTARNCCAYVTGIEQVLPDGNRKDWLPNDVRQMMW